MTIFSLVHAGDLFIKIKDHQHHANSFLSHLETLVTENPQWVKDSDLEDADWNHIKEILKAMWRKYHNPRLQNSIPNYKRSHSLSRTIFESYLKN